VSGPEQLPQSSTLLHPSETVPQAAPSWAQVLATHGDVPQTFGPPPPHKAPPAHDPQSTVPMQPSDRLPQFAPSWAHVFGVQPQAFGSPSPPHFSGGKQPPQSIAAEQPSEIHPHCAPTVAHVVGTHMPVPHLLGPPPPQICSPEHTPHSITAPQSSGAEPHSAPISVQLTGLHVAEPPSPTSVVASPEAWSTKPASDAEPALDAAPSSLPQAVNPTAVTANTEMVTRRVSMASGPNILCTKSIPVEKAYVRLARQCLSR